MQSGTDDNLPDEIRQRFSASLLARQRRFRRQRPLTAIVPLTRIEGWRAGFQGQAFTKSMIADWLPGFRPLAIRNELPATVGTMALPLRTTVPPLDLHVLTALLADQAQPALTDRRHVPPARMIAQLGQGSSARLNTGRGKALSYATDKVMQRVLPHPPNPVAGDPVVPRSGRSVAPVHQQPPALEKSAVAASSDIATPPSFMALDPALRPDPRLHTFLERVLHFPIPPVNIVTGQTADRVARRFDADAVTFGHNILFREGRYKPQHAQGIALLGHEMTHAALATTLPHLSGRPAAAAAEERLAQQNERTVLRYLTPASQERKQSSIVKPTPVLGQATTHRHAPMAATTPQTASVGRNIGINETGMSAAKSGQPALSEQQMKRRKEDFQYFIQWVQTEGERG